MGHIRFGGGLPRTQKWREVIDLVAQGGSAGQVAEATLEATEQQFMGAGSDAAVVHTVWLLTQLPDAARQGDFAENLRALGIAVSASPSAVELANAVSRAIDDHVQALGRPRSDLGEMARLTAVETLAGLLDDRSQRLFATSELLVFDGASTMYLPAWSPAREAAASLATPKRFGELARDFFARLTERSLNHYVSRELPLHVGASSRFQTVAEQRAFQEEVSLHARQASRIVETFAGGWYSKARYERDLTHERTARFVGYAMKKLRAELRMGAQ